MTDERSPDPVPSDAPERRQGDPSSEDAPMDTGMPPGTHPNSEDPDPEVVEKAERENDPHPSDEKLNEDYRPAGEPPGDDPLKDPARPDTATAD